MRNELEIVWSPFLVWDTQSTIFWYPKLGTFGKSAHFQVQKKWHFGCPNENSETTFISPTFPKNNGFYLEKMNKL